MRNLSIKMRLIVTLGIMGVLLIVIGVMGVVGLSRSNDSLNDMYTRDMVPTAQIAEIQELLAEGDTTDYGQLEPVPSGFFEDEDPRLARRAA